MRAVVQRVTDARLTINQRNPFSIGRGLVILLGIEAADGMADIEWLTGKISRLRIFNDPKGLMNLSVVDTLGEVMVISQFTLHASTKKGNRPSFIKAATPELAMPLYQRFIACMERDLGRPVVSGEFGAYMQVNLTNDGPVTIIIDTKEKE
jgi:D-tyrosyl-tRNA(Tyr) deacylase